MEERLMEAPCGFISIDSSGCILEVNNRYLIWMGYRKEEVIGKHIDTFLTKVNQMFIHTYFFPTIQMQGSVEEVYINLTNSAGDSVPVLLNARQYMKNTVLVIDCIFIQMRQRIDYEMELRLLQKTTEKAYRDREEAFAQLEKIYVEIEAKQREILNVNEELLKISNTDKLTGIPNRRFMHKEMARHVERFYDEGISFSVLMVDIDYFKKVNDTYGHLIGDRVLIQLASVLTQSIRTDDCVARLGGEEFVIILSEMGAADALEFAVKLNKIVEMTNWELIDRLTVSAGVSTFVAGDTEMTILSHADEALYQAKANGRNTSFHFQDMF